MRRSKCIKTSNLPAREAVQFTFDHPNSLKSLTKSKFRWQEVDPNYTETPYNEPDAQLEGGIIALCVIVGALFVAAGAWLLYRRAVDAQRRRYKEHFVRGIARNIDIAPTAGMIGSDELKKEFNHIDKDGGGSISKDELKSFVKDGKVGHISDKDFEALWCAIDIDNSGEVDFVVRLLM